MNLAVEIPKPSRYIKHSVIDQIANEVAKAWCSQNPSMAEDKIDIEDFVSHVLKKELDWEIIDEPANRTCFAALVGDKILLNANYRSLFAEKPFMLRSSLAHEAGHEILRHADKLYVDENQLSLFGDVESQQLRFHDSSLRRFDVSDEEYFEIRQRLARESAISPDARELLAALEDRLEPEWMFYQAEQFGSCFLIPKDRLFHYLESGLDLCQWRSLYALAEKFGVSISMMSVRLQKLGLISIDNKQIRLIPQTLRLSLL